MDEFPQTAIEEKQPQHAEHAWRKARRSIQGGHCVEVAFSGPYVHVRDSRAAAGPQLRFSAKAWSSFTEYVKDSRP